jgi:glycosyltransferase involved in cell wall biosynthesis
MKILVAQDSIDTDGGVETYLLSTIAELRTRGHQVALLYCRRSTGRTPVRGAAEFALGIEERGLNDVLSELREWSPEVCFSHNMEPLEIDRVLTGEWPVVKMLHGYFGTCVSGLKMHAFPGADVCHRTFGAACLALYVPRRCGQLSPLAMVRGYRWASDQQALFPRYAALVVASNYMRDEMIRHGVSAERVNALPLFSTVPIDAGVGSHTEDTVLFGARMTTLKGGHVLIAAAARASRTIGRSVRLLMAGEGPQKEQWRQLASSLDVPAEFTGWIREEDRARVYGRAAIVAVPSLWPEPFGLIGLDAAALGKPAVAFDVGGIHEWLTDGANGLLVAPAAGEQGLANAIARLLSAPEERVRMACESLRTATRLSVAAHVDRLEQLLQRAAG